MRTVMVFGVFDGLHEGHREFLRQAKACGDRLLAVVTPDEVVEKLKNRAPRFDFDTRAAAIMAEGLADYVIAGDTELGSWDVIRRERPDVIALGYDQQALDEALKEALREMGFAVEVRTMEPHEPEKYKSSIMRVSPPGRR